MSRSIILKSGKILCPVCGQPTDRLIEGVCPKCYAKEHKLVELKKRELTIPVCKICGAYIDSRGKWVRKGFFDVDKVVAEYLKSIYKVKGIVKEVRISRVDENVYELEFYGRAHRDLKNDYWEKYSLNVRLNYTLCPNCMNLQARHEEAKIQVRALNRTLSGIERKQILKDIRNVLIDLYQRNSAAQPLEIKESENGIDVTLTSKNVARELVSRLSLKHFFKILETSKDIGVDDSGRAKRRTTYRLLLPPFKLYDLVKYGGKVYLILGFRKNKITVFNLESQRIESLSLNKNIYKEAERITSVFDLEEGIIISADRGSLQVMSLKDYHIFDIYYREEKNALKFKINDKVKIYKIDNKVFLIPSSLIRH